MNGLRTVALYLAWVIALTGTLLSIYYGEILRVEPCQLCWYQRTMWFPLALLLGIAAYRADEHILPYAVVLACVGELVAIYQILGESFRWLHVSSLCGFGADCSVPVMVFFGLFSMPALSAVGFGGVIALLLFAVFKK
jgi:disulfide bond formation protein DsbB